MWQARYGTASGPPSSPPQPSLATPAASDAAPDPLGKWRSAAARRALGRAFLDVHVLLRVPPFKG